MGMIWSSATCPSRILQQYSYSFQQTEVPPAEAPAVEMQIIIGCFRVRPPSFRTVHSSSLFQRWISSQIAAETTAPSSVSADRAIGERRDPEDGMYRAMTGSLPAC